MKYPGHESTVLEFKAEAPKNDQIVKTVIGFCNQNGGKLVLGVKDDGTVVGVSTKELGPLLDALPRAIYQATSPPIVPRISTQRLGEKTILVIEVSAGMNPPYYKSADGLEKGTYIRLATSTLRAGAEAIEELRWRSLGRYYDEMVVHRASERDIDHSKVDHFLKQRKAKAEAVVSPELLHAYQITAEEHGQTYPTVGGLLLFGKDPSVFFSESFIICTHFRGTSGRDVIATRDCVGTLFDQFIEAYDFVASRLYRSFVIKGPKRDEKLEIPEEALREILLNALVHRNYHIRAPTKIAIYEDRVEIFSPGTFPGPLDTDQLTLGITYVRNQVITRLFREAQYMEKLGSGFITLFNSYATYNLTTPQVIEGPGFVKCILPRTSATSAQLEPAKEKILQLLQTTESIAMGDLVKADGLSRTTAKRWLDQLIEKGLVTRHGQGRGTRYSASHNPH